MQEEASESRNTSRVYGQRAVGTGERSVEEREDFSTTGAGTTGQTRSGPSVTPHTNVSSERLTASAATASAEGPRRKRNGQQRAPAIP